MDKHIYRLVTEDVDTVLEDKYPESIHWTEGEKQGLYKYIRNAIEFDWYDAIDQLIEMYMEETEVMK